MAGRKTSEEHMGTLPKALKQKLKEDLLKNQFEFQNGIDYTVGIVVRERFALLLGICRTCFYQ